MRLKSLLLENDKVVERIETPEELEDLWDNGQFINNGLKLLRGTHQTIYDGGVIKKMRKDREPLDTKRVVHEFISALSNLPENDRFPSRKESKFAATVSDMSYLRQYGSNIHYVFPAGNAQIVSLRDDAHYIMNDIGRNLSSNMRQTMGYFYGDHDQIDYEERRDNYPDLAKFVKSIAHREWNQMSQILKNAKNDVIEQAKALADDQYGGTGFEAEDIVEAFRLADEYFDSLWPGVLGSQKEVMFNGSYYLLVRKSWLEDNFEIKNGRWVRKNG